MNLNCLLQLGMVLVLSFSLSSCLKDQCEREATYIASVPVYLTKDEIRVGSLTSESPKNLKDPSQFYYYQNHIFIIERGEGIHVINNEDPEAPNPVAFLNIPGAEQMAIKNALLYVNNYIDLLTIDITDINNAKMIKRTEDVFDPIWEDVSSGQILVTYRLETITETMDCSAYGSLVDYNGVFYSRQAFDFAFSSPTIASNSTFENFSGSQATTGVGGSMARFTVVGDYLYTVDDWTLDVISLQTPDCPEYKSTIDLGWGIETIFPYGDNLFIGSSTGMFIFDNSNPEAPVQLAVFQHARACDPVFVKDNYAYVTLRDGNTCAGFVNQLDLVDITDLENPVLEKTFPMDHPHGLTIRNDHLFLCEGMHGLKAFDISDPIALDANELDHEDGFDAFDAISLPGSRPITIVIGEDGFYQFEFTEETGFELLSTIDIKK